MRIALSHLYAWPEVRRGAERYTHELGAGLLRAGHDVVLITSGTAPGRSIELDVPVRRLRRRGYLGKYGDAGLGIEFGAKAFAALGTKRLDAWHAMSAGDAAAATLLGTVRPGLRSIYTECGFPARRSREQRADRHLYAYTTRHVDEFICLSEPAGDLLTTDYGRIGHVVGGGVDMKVFRPLADRHPTPVLLFPAALSEPRKNVGLALEAAALLREGGTPVELWLVGPGTLPTELSPLAQKGLESVTVHRTASESELVDLYSKAWVTVLPSNAEVFGLVVLESLACGTPGIVLDDGLGPSRLVTAGTGVACQPDAADLTRACGEALELAGDATTAERCRGRAADFDWDTAIVPRIVEIYSGAAQQ